MLPFTFTLLTSKFSSNGYTNINHAIHSLSLSPRSSFLFNLLSVCVRAFQSFRSSNFYICLTRKFIFMRFIRMVFFAFPQLFESQRKQLTKPTKKLRWKSLSLKITKKCIAHSNTSNAYEWTSKGMLSYCAIRLITFTLSHTLCSVELKWYVFFPMLHKELGTRPAPFSIKRTLDQGTFSFCHRTMNSSGRHLMDVDEHLVDLFQQCYAPSHFVMPLLNERTAFDVRRRQADGERHSDGGKLSIAFH